MDESLGASAAYIRVHRNSQHPLHHPRFYSVSYVLFSMSFAVRSILCYILMLQAQCRVLYFSSNLQSKIRISVKMRSMSTFLIKKRKRNWMWNISG